MIDRSFVALACWLMAACSAPISAQEGPRAVTIEAIPGIVDADGEWQLAWQGTNNADGLVAGPDGGLLFAQEQPQRIGRLDVDDRYSIFLSGTRHVGSLSIDSDGRLLGVERTCTDPGRRTGGECTEPTAISVIAPARRVLADRFADGAPLGRLNDLVADRHGGVYFTVGGAYYVDAIGIVTSLGDDWRTNGIILSPDERTLYVTNREVIVALDVLPDGGTTNRRNFALLEAGGSGDGMTVDSAGRLYVTSGPGVQVFSSEGDYLGLIPTPRNAISVAFAGPDKRMLYIVGSGAMLGPGNSEFTTDAGVRNNAKTIYKIRMTATGYAGRAK